MENLTARQVFDNLDRIGMGAYSTKETLLNSYNSALNIITSNTEGDFVECGVAAGSQIAAMELACRVKGVKRKIWAFDSFEGIPMAKKGKDTSQPAIGEIPEINAKSDEDYLVSSGVTCHSLENVQSNLNIWGADINQFTFVKGWFQKTLPKEAKKIEKISILRLDGDLYDSTRVCLEHLFPKLVSGGILIIDDWALDGCKLACDEYFKDYKLLGKLNEVENSTPVWFIKK